MLFRSRFVQARLLELKGDLEKSVDAFKWFVDRYNEKQAEIVTSADPAAVIVNDVPLLVENNLQVAYEIVIVVEAAESARVARLVADRGMTESDAHARIAAQATDEQRRAVADVVITNDGTRDQLNDQVDAVWRDRLQRG